MDSKTDFHAEQYVRTSEQTKASAVRHNACLKYQRHFLVSSRQHFRIDHWKSEKEELNSKNKHSTKLGFAKPGILLTKKINRVAQADLRHAMQHRLAINLPILLPLTLYTRITSVQHHTWLPSPLQIQKNEKTRKKRRANADLLWNSLNRPLSWLNKTKTLIS